MLIRLPHWIPLQMFSTQKNPNTNSSTEVPSGPEDTVSMLSWAPNANFLAASSWDKSVRIYEVHPAMGVSNCTVTPRLSYTHDQPVLACSFSNDNVFSAGCDAKVKMYNLQAQREQIIGAHDQPIVACIWVEELRMVVTASWDATIRFWNGTSPTPVMTIPLKDRIYTVDIKFPLMVVGCADKKVAVFNLQTIQHNPNPYKVMESALRLQTRVVSCFPDKSGFALGSIEGRVSIAYIEDNMKDKNFAFKCHRTTDEIYPVNSIDFHPFFPESFATCGGDGTFVFWDKAAKQKLKGFNSCNFPITASRFSSKGDLFAYAVGYDWAKGFESNHANIPKKVFIHRVQEIEVKPKPGTGLNAFPKRR
jgi:mRNA export factor